MARLYVRLVGPMLLISRSGCVVVFGSFRPSNVRFLQGVRVHIRQMGPMIQQTQAPCNSCRHGKVIPEGKKCPKCRGGGTTKERKVLEVFIEKGAPDGHRVVFKEEADEKPDTTPGDVRFIVSQQVRITKHGEVCLVDLHNRDTSEGCLEMYRCYVDALEWRC